MNHEEITLKYFNSWQAPADFDELASYLTNNFKIDAGLFSFSSKEDFVQFLKANPTPWKDVRLLSSIYSEDGAAILYEGINTATNAKMRVAEHIQFEGMRIAKIYTVITQLD